MESNKIFEFIIFGKPETQGSLTSFKHFRTGKVVTPQSKKVLDHRKKIQKTICCMLGIDVKGLIEGPVSIGLRFYAKRPKSHFEKNGVDLKKGYPEYPTLKSFGDIDKLTRLVLDALTGVIYVDDSQVVDFEYVSKRYSEIERTEISIFKIED